MKKSKNNITINSLLHGIIIMTYGLVLIINVVLEGKITNTIGNWYELLCLALMLMSVVNAFCRKAPQYLIIIFTLIGFYLYLRLARYENNMGYLLLLPILFLSIGIGTILSYFATKGKSGLLKSGIICTFFSTIFFIASLLDIYKLIIPALIIGVGLIWMISSFGSALGSNINTSEIYENTKNKVLGDNDERKD